MRFLLVSGFLLTLTGMTIANHLNDTNGIIFLGFLYIGFILLANGYK